MYQPVLARFTALDPLPPDGEAVLLGFPPRSNSYSYARNDPLNYADPSGMAATAFSDDDPFLPDGPAGCDEKKQTLFVNAGSFRCTVSVAGFPIAIPVPNIIPQIPGQIGNCFRFTMGDGGGAAGATFDPAATKGPYGIGCKGAVFNPLITPAAIKSLTCSAEQGCIVPGTKCCSGAAPAHPGPGQPPNVNKETGRSTWNLPVPIPSANKPLCYFVIQLKWEYDWITQNGTCKEKCCPC